MAINGRRESASSCSSTEGSPAATAVTAADESDLVCVVVQQHVVVDHMQVDVQSLDAQMVALHRKQNSLQAVLQRQEDLCQQLTQVASHHIMKCLLCSAARSMLALPAMWSKNQKEESTPFCCHKQSLLRQLVVSPYVLCMTCTCATMLAAGSCCDIVVMSLLQLVLCESGYAPGSEPVSWETATTQLD